MNRPILVALLSSMVACGGGNSSPSPSPTPTPPPVTVGSLSGTVKARGGAPLSNATVTILDGSNAGKSAGTNGAGEYRLDNLLLGNANIAGKAPGYKEARGGLNIDGNRTANFTLETAVAWSKTGTGNTVFDMPTWIERVRIIGTYSGGSSNFIVYVGGDLIVNDFVGSHWDPHSSDGVYLVTGGVTEIKSSQGVKWSFEEIR